MQSPIDIAAALLTGMVLAFGMSTPIAAAAENTGAMEKLNPAGASATQAPTQTAAGAVDWIDGADPDALHEIALGYGTAELGRDSSGDPMIQGRLRGVKYAIFFFGCDGQGAECTDILFYAAWGGAQVPMDRINQWNKTKKFGKAYLDDDGDASIDMSLNLEHGVTRKNLDDTFDWWRVAVEGFEDEVLSAAQ